MQPVISVIGAGLMGSALVKAFVKQGYETHVWNRTRARAEALASDGARVSGTVSDAVKTADIVVLNVSDYATSNALVRATEVERLLEGKLLLQLTTGTPRQSRDMAAWAEERRIRYLDGAIMVTPDLVGGPDCAVFYSGPAPLFDEYRSVLQSLGGRAQHVGADYGYASTLDSAILSFFWPTTSVCTTRLRCARPKPSPSMCSLRHWVKWVHFSPTWAPTQAVESRHRTSMQTSPPSRSVISPYGC